MKNSSTSSKSKEKQQDLSKPRVGSLAISLPRQRDHQLMESAFKSKTHRVVDTAASAQSSHRGETNSNSLMNGDQL